MAIQIHAMVTRPSGYAPPQRYHSTLSSKKAPAASSRPGPVTDSRQFGEERPTVSGAFLTYSRVLTYDLDHITRPIIGGASAQAPPLTVGRSHADLISLFEIAVRGKTPAQNHKVDRGEAATETKSHWGVGPAKFQVSARVKALILNERVGTMVLTLG